LSPYKIIRYTKINHFLADNRYFRLLLGPRSSWAFKRLRPK